MEGNLLLCTINDIPHLGWVPRSALDFRLRSAFSRQHDTSETICDPATLEGLIVAPLDSLVSITIEAQLTLLKGRAVAICMVSILTESSPSKFQNLWFDPVESKLDSAAEVLTELREWVRLFNRDLIGLNDGSCIYYLSPLDPIQSRWPSVLPKPNQTVFQFGQFGLNLISSVLGAPAKNTVEDVGFNVLERFAQVTHFAKDKTTQAMSHPLAQPFLPLIPENVRDQFLSSAEAEALINDYDSAQRYIAQFSADIQTRIGGKDRANPTEPDTTHDFSNLQKLYKSHFTGTPLTLEVWESWFTDGILTVSPQYVRSFIFCGGVEPQLRKEIWPRILKAYAWTTPRFYRDEDKESQYERMKQTWAEVLQDAGNVSPVRFDMPQDGAVGDENENADVITKITDRIYRIDKDVVRTDQTVDHFTMNPPLDNSVSLAINIKANPNLVHLRNVLMTYTVFDFELGYVQGMNDLSSPILEVLPNEAEAFWSFVGFMERM